MIPIKVDPWLRDVVCDPVSKTSVRIEDDRIVSDYGRSYPIAHGVFDLRALSCNVGITGELWRKGQSAYEEWSTRAALTSAKTTPGNALVSKRYITVFPSAGDVLT